jgi:hydrogenase expression/formation protein HypE
MSTNERGGLYCPNTIGAFDQILLAHGSGGKLMQQLLNNLIFQIFDDSLLHQGHDGSLLEPPHNRLIMTTDSYVVRPLVFCGGDIGTLAVNGTVNDLAMCGARPLYMSVGLILEEGLPVSMLETILISMKKAAQQSGIRIVTGDTKVVERGKCDGMYINTTGIGSLEVGSQIFPGRIQAGDSIIVSGDIGRHGMAVMSAREGLSFSRPIQSDCAPLWELVRELLDARIDITCMRDITRGGLSSVLKELAIASKLQFSLIEGDIMVESDVRSACEVLGVDPLHVACEGRFVLFVPSHSAEAAVGLLNRCYSNRFYSESPGIMGSSRVEARVVGEVISGKSGIVTLRTPIGGNRLLEPPTGEILPRIC